MSRARLRALARSSDRPVRVGLLRICHETHALNPVLTEFAAFEASHCLGGPALLAACDPGGHEVEGYLRRAELSGAVAAIRDAGAEPVPLLSVWGIPSGPLSEGCMVTLEGRLDAALDAGGALDAVVVVMHGAMTSVRGPLAEAELLERVRARVGPGVPLVLVLDLHAHLTPRKLAPVDAVLGYQTNPHRDHVAVGEKAGWLAVALARGMARIHQAWRMLPMVIGGGTTLDVLPTMLPAFWRMWRLDRRPEVLHATLFMSHLWHDAPDLGWSTCVITDAALDPDGAAADAAADALADALWAVRDVPPPRFLSADEAIEDARRAVLARRLGVVAMSDASDNVAAGGHGANTNLLAALVARGQGLRSYVALKEPAALAALAGAAPGDPVALRVGGQLDPERCPPVAVRGRLVRHAGHEAMGRMAVLDLDHVQLVLSEAAPLAMMPSFYGDVGLPPWRADVHVVKSFFHFRWYYRWLSRRTLYVRTRGITDLDLALEQPFAFPVHPRDRIEDWRPHDRARRAGRRPPSHASGADQGSA